MLHRSHTGCTLGRRRILPECSWPRCSTVSRLTLNPTCPHPIRSICYSRHCRYSLLPMYGCVAQSYRSHKGKHQVGARRLHRSNVLFCDNIHSDTPQHLIHFLHQQPRIPWCRQPVRPRTSWIPLPHLFQGDQRRS